MLTETPPRWSDLADEFQLADIARLDSDVVETLEDVAADFEQLAGRCVDRDVEFLADGGLAVDRVAAFPDPALAQPGGRSGAATSQQPEECTHGGGRDRVGCDDPCDKAKGHAGRGGV